MAARALRKLHSSLHLLDPEIAEDLFAESLLTRVDKEKIDAGNTPTKKASLILNTLGRREPKKALQGLIRALEKDKIENEEMLKKISEVYPDYKYSPGEETATDAGTAATSPSGPSSLPPIGLGTAGARPPGLPDHRVVPIAKITKLHVKESADRYLVNSSPRGYCVIINNVHFKSMSSREGSNLDASTLRELFGDFLDFDTQRFNDLESEDILAVLRSVQEKDHSELGCLVVAILSHGRNGEIYGTDGVVLSVKEIMDYFCGTRCPSLVGKPKVFILQACRGEQYDHGVVIEGTDSATVPEVMNEDEILGQDETDGGGYNRALPNEVDFILAYATTPGYVSWRDSGFGSWFVKAFADSMRSLAATDHLMDILTEVNRKVAEEYESKGKQKQMPAPVSMLRYKLFLTPGPRAK